VEWVSGWVLGGFPAGCLPALLTGPASACLLGLGGMPGFLGFCCLLTALWVPGWVEGFCIVLFSYTPAGCTGSGFSIVYSNNKHLQFSAGWISACRETYMGFLYYIYTIYNTIYPSFVICLLYIWFIYNNLFLDF